MNCRYLVVHIMTAGR